MMQGDQLLRRALPDDLVLEWLAATKNQSDVGISPEIASKTEQRAPPLAPVPLIDRVHDEEGP